MYKSVRNQLRVVLSDAVMRSTVIVMLGHE
jgi:hypothetical protein